MHFNYLIHDRKFPEVNILTEKSFDYRYFMFKCLFHTQEVTKLIEKRQNK